jgi:hypothetical protein
MVQNANAVAPAMEECWPQGTHGPTADAAPDGGALKGQALFSRLLFIFFNLVF